ncbi:MAG TPA: hypothetical protein VFN53_07375 [Acidobacteriaceae bacterium]|nr:hypothetical protein [Acidobacteriaceae bacterium]
MLPIGYLNGKFPCYALQVLRSRTRDDDYGHVPTGVVHGGRVLQGKGTMFAAQCSGEQFHRNIPCRTKLGIASREHFALGRAFQIASEFLVGGESADAFGNRRSERADIDGECTPGVWGMVFSVRCAGAAGANSTLTSRIAMTGIPDIPEMSESLSA